MSLRVRAQRKVGSSKSSLRRAKAPAPPNVTGPVSQTLTQDFDQLSPQDYLHLQRSLGNQAVLQLMGGGRNGPPSGTLLRTPMIQRLPEAAAIQEAVDQDVEKKKKAEAESAKKTPVAPTSSTPTSSTPAPEKSLGEKALDALTSIGKAIYEVLDKASYEAVIKALNDFHTYDKAFKKLTPAYTDHIERLKHIKAIEVATDGFIALHKPGDPGFARISKLRGEAVETYIKASPNADRALAARSELKAKKKADKSSPTRITDDLIELMVMSVASPMSETSDMGASGILGVQSAVDAADALMLMRQEDYQKIVDMLAASGDSLGETAKKATLLKAVAARKADLIKAGPQTDDALKQLEDFRAKITGMNRAEMIDKTHVADHGSGVGLQQRFTMSCGPTSIQITKGEFDPIYALQINEEGRKSLKFDNNLANDQKAKLEGQNGVNTAVPRDVEDEWNKALPLIQGYFGTAPNPDKVKIQHFIKSIQGVAHDATKAADGLALVKANVAGIDFDKHVPLWTKYYAFLGAAPGLGNSQFATMAKTELGASTGRNFNETAIAYKEKIMADGKKELRGEIAKHFKALDKALFRGKSVPLGVMWASGGGHFMVFTEMMVKKEGGKNVKYYLVSDPWEGHSGWMTRQDLILGKFGLIGASQGAIDSIYL